MTGLHQTTRFLRFLFVILVISSLMAGCSLSLPGFAEPSPTPGIVLPVSTPVPVPEAEVTFIAHIPANTPVGQGISLDILDEITGLALNAKQNLMSPVQNGVYAVKITAPLGAVLKYRYSRISSPPSIEYTSTGNQVRYRLFSVTGPAQVEDEISGWTDLKYTGLTGRIQGTAIDSTNNAPIPGLLVEAGGVHVITSSEGSFLLEGLPPGKHNLFVYSLDGKYQPFQQEAVVGADATTPAPLSLIASNKIKVTFTVSIPPSTLNPLPIRLIGNLYSLGNTFADLGGGFSTVANRAPLLTPVANGNYSITLELPAGFHLQYKYSLGDGFWNAEHTVDGQFRLREIVLPSQDISIVDHVDSWKAPKAESVTFTVTVPANTPSGDYVSIQFNPFGWTESIPMWPLGNNQWVYTLYSPLNILGNVGYRYCRNDACGAADDSSTTDPIALGWPISSSLIHQDFQDTVDHWAWWQPSGQPTTVVATDVVSKGSGFIAGVELQKNYQPGWLATMGSGYQTIKNLGANWVFLSPTFRYTRNTPPVLEAVPGKDMLWQDSNSAILLAQSNGLLVGLHAQTVIEGDVNEWWKSAERNENWWANWFARYRTFALNFADMAASTNAGALMLGDENLLPAYPGGLLSDSTSSNVPGNADQKWRDLIAEIRTHYHGLLMWSIPSPSGFSNIPGFLDQVDGISFTLQNSLTDTDSPTQSDLNLAIGSIMDTSIKQIQDHFGKPVIINIEYPSVNGIAQGCLLINGNCQPFSTLDEVVTDNDAVQLDLQEQVDIYNACMQAVNTRSWINGVVSGGFFSPATLQDKSSSIHGKPASDIVWYWFHEFMK